jgi:hypothetical protein
VPLIKPSAVNIIVIVPLRRPARFVPPTTTSLCQTRTSYNATAPAFAAARSAMVPQTVTITVKIE